jgi:hypothetical protein
MPCVLQSLRTRTDWLNGVSLISIGSGGINCYDNFCG